MNQKKKVRGPSISKKIIASKLKAARALPVATKKGASSATRGSVKAAGEMSSVLRQRADNIRRELEQAGQNDAVVRVRLGALVLDAQKDPKKYGKKAVNQLASHLGVERSRLYRAATVASIWSPAVVSKLMKKGAVEFGHLELLAQEKDEAKRDDLLAAVANDHLSIRDLRKMTTGAKVVAVVAPVKKIEAMVDALEKSIARLQEAELEGEVDDDDRAQLQLLAERVEKLKPNLTAAADHIDDLGQVGEVQDLQEDVQETAAE